MSERESISYLEPEQDGNEIARYHRAQIEQWLGGQRDQAKGIGHQIGSSTDELISMTDGFSPEAMRELYSLTETNGEQEKIFGALLQTQRQIARDPNVISKYPKDAARMAEARIRGIVAQWPLLDQRGRRFNTHEYNTWVAGRDNNHQAKAA